MELAYPAEEFRDFFLLDKVVVKCNNLDSEENVKAEINQHLDRLRESFDRYFSQEI